MVGMQGRAAHCYRCLHVWRIRRATRPAVCPRCCSRLWNVPKLRTPRLGNGLGIEEILLPHRTEILRLASRYGASRVRIFGSVRRREARPDSDVDLLVEWKSHHRPVAFLDFPLALERLLGREVDVVSEESLHWSIRPTVEFEAVPL